METKRKKDNNLLSDLHKLKLEIRKLREELRSERTSNPQIEKNFHFLDRELFSQSGPGLLQRVEEIPSKETHYERNQFMSDVPQSPEIAAECGWDDSVGVACHQFMSPDRTNRK